MVDFTATGDIDPKQAYYLSGRSFGKTQMARDLMEQKIKESKPISRWLLTKLVLRVGLHILLILAGWGAIVWGSFLLAFPLGLIVTGISLISIAWALNRVIEDRFFKLAEVYAGGVFPAGEKLEGSDEAVALGMPMYPDDWEGNEDEPMAESSLTPLFDKSDLSADYVPPLQRVKLDDDVIIEHEVSENGQSDDMVFEFDEAVSVKLDEVDKEIDDILQSGK